MIDATHLKVRRTAASLLKKGLVSRRIRQTKGGLSSKLHAVCDGASKPIILLLSEGQMTHHLLALSLRHANVGSQGIGSNHGLQEQEPEGLPSASRFCDLTPGLFEHRHGYLADKDIVFYDGNFMLSHHIECLHELPSCPIKRVGLHNGNLLRSVCAPRESSCR